MDQVGWRRKLFQVLQPFHAFQRLGKERPTDQAALAVGLKGLPHLVRQLAFQGLGQECLELAALNLGLGVTVIHCLPAFYYEKVISQVPCGRGLFGI